MEKILEKIQLAKEKLRPYGIAKHIYMTIDLYTKLKEHYKGNVCYIVPNTIYSIWGMKIHIIQQQMQPQFIVTINELNLEENNENIRITKRET